MESKANTNPTNLGYNYCLSQDVSVDFGKETTAPAARPAFLARSRRLWTYEPCPVTVRLWARF